MSSHARRSRRHLASSAARALAASVFVTLAAACASCAASPSDPGLDSSPSTSRGTLPKGVLAVIRAPGGPLLVAAGSGSVWVGSHRGTTLYRIDPATNKIIARVYLGMIACSVSAGLGRVWVGGCAGSLGTAVVDPANNQIAGLVPYEALQVGFGAGSAWLATPPDPGGTRIIRINPVTLRVRATIGSLHQAASGGTGLVFADGSLWIMNSGSATVTRMNPATGRVIATIAAGTTAADELVAGFAAGKLWIWPHVPIPGASGDAAGNKIWRIDPATNRVQVLTLPVSGTSNALFTTGLGSLWVRAAGTVYRFDPHTLGLLGTYPADGATSGFVAIASGSLWVANVDSETVWRDLVRG
jgi:DNA-binding beta-propeller fold protein YncE